MRTNKDYKEKVFTTLDAYLSGFLTLKGFTPELVDQGDKVVFVFSASDGLYQAISEYNSGATVEAVRLVLATKALKSQIHSLRRNNEKRHQTTRKPIP